MIEYKAHYPWGKEEATWREYGKQWQSPTSKVNMSVYKFRIDGVIYEEYSEELIKAFAISKLWNKLKG